ncbi:MAG: hypothetical protein HC831_24565, partial [Chloroflexia bacterium]|nr:hypothetical protein [Chloroflexia bacterium]
MGPGGTVIIDDATSYITLVSGLPSGGVQNTFTWTITKGGCSASDFVNVYNNEFTISAGGPYESCDNTIEMLAENPGVGYGVWKAVDDDDEDKIQSPSVFNTEILDLEPGNSFFKWTVYRNGCEASDEATVVNNTIEANAGTYIPICEDEVNLSAEFIPGTASGFWEL